MSEKKNNLKPRIIRGCDPDSFAKYTIDIRFPHIINEIIRDNEFTSNSIINLENLINEVKAGEIIQFKDSNLEDSNRWNKYVSSYLGKSWYEVPFLFAEMYLYRRILEANGHVLVTGGPGSGKTTIALQKAIKYISADRNL